MNEKFAEKVLKFKEELSNMVFNLPENYHIKNPFNGENAKKINEITHTFYKKYYNDNNKRYLILGSSPAKKGSAVTGIPFEDAFHLYKITGIQLDNFYINKSSSDFLNQIIEQYGGCEKFYKEFYMNFV